MKNTIDMMVQLLDKNNIPIRDHVWNKDGKTSSYNKEKFHALVAGYSNSCTFIIDLGAYRHMDFTREIFSSIHLSSGLVVRMGDDFEIHTNWVGRINLNHGYFGDFIYVPDLETNLLWV